MAHAKLMKAAAEPPDTDPTATGLNQPAQKKGPLFPGAGRQTVPKVIANSMSSVTP